MSQQRLRDYKEEILSFDHNIFNLGMHNPGRYCGFDTIVRVSALAFSVNHSATGVQYKNQINDTIGPVGVLLTPQGVIVMEDAAITGLTIETNAGNSVKRFDLIVCDHDFAVTPGGTAATYQVIKGPVGTPILPILTDPLKQVAVGVIELPPVAEDIADCIYSRSKCPDSGDGEDARLNEPNMFTSFQGQITSAMSYPAGGDSHTSGAHIAKLWDLDNDGNTFAFLADVAPDTIDGIYLKNIPLQQGMRINLLVNSNFLIRESVYFESSAKYALGYRGFTINPGLGNETLVSPGGGGSLLAIRPTAGEIWDIECVFKDNRWFVSKIGGAGTNSAFRRGMQMEWYGDVAANFDAAGLGVNLMSGWHICNGNASTPDRRGKMAVMATDVPAAGRPVLTEPQVIIDGGDPEDYIFGNAYSLQGKRKFLIGQVNLPDYALPVTDPGHTHTYEKLNDASHPGGSSQTDRRNPTSAVTGSSTTGISVNSGGNDERLEHIPPVWMTVIVMKL